MTPEQYKWEVARLGITIRQIQRDLSAAKANEMAANMLADHGIEAPDPDAPLSSVPCKKCGRQSVSLDRKGGAPMRLLCMGLSLHGEDAHKIIATAWHIDAEAMIREWNELNRKEGTTFGPKDKEFVDAMVKEGFLIKKG